MKRWLAVSACSALVTLSTLAGVYAQGTAFTYQGFLRQGGAPANGNHDFQFSLWTEESGGSQIGSTQTVTNVSVQNGLFTVTLGLWECVGRQQPLLADCGASYPCIGQSVLHNAFAPCAD